MTSPRNSRIFGPHRPDWQERLPRQLRVAAECLFGSFVLAGAVSAVRTGRPEAIPAGIFGTALAWLFLTGFREDRRIESPVLWWAMVILLSAIGFSVAVALVFDPPR